ncbi:MAG: MinD/ParA family ATP-binding protein [Brevibacterium sp.]
MITEGRASRFDGAQRADDYEEPPYPEVRPDVGPAEDEPLVEGNAEPEPKQMTEYDTGEGAVYDPLAVLSGDDDELEPAQVRRKDRREKQSIWEKLSLGLYKAGPSEAELAEEEAREEEARAEREAQQRAVAAAEERTRQERAEAERVIRQSEWVRPPGILLANDKGSSFKTPGSIGIAAALSVVRGGSVAIQEVSDDRGTLSLRAEGFPARGIERLIDDVDQVHAAGQLAAYSAPQTSYVAVFGTVGDRRRLTGEDVTKVAGVIDTYYRIRLMDSGNVPSSEAFEAAVETTDVLVIPTSMSLDSAMRMADLVKRLKNGKEHARSLAERAIVVCSHDGRPESPAATAAVEEQIEKIDPLAVYNIPFDEHIAERDEITWSRLAPATQDAFTHLAAAVVTEANHAINN